MMTRPLLLTVIYCILLSSCSLKEENQLMKYADPFIGTDTHGHTFPGAASPFGMVQLGPDTGTEGWDWCSGYHYSDSSIIGFSHTHLSGTGGADLGDILIMPFTGSRKWEPGTKANPDAGYRSRFSHDQEQASPGYYAVHLDDYDIKAEMTVTPRVGIHRYEFPKSKKSRFIIDLKHGISDSPKNCWIKVNGNSEVIGMRHSQGWAADQYVYFVARFSKEFRSYVINADGEEIKDKSEAKGQYTKTILDFTTTNDEEIMVKVAISAVDIDGAYKNLKEEAPHWSFKRYKNKIQKTWEKSLEKIKVEGGTEEKKTVFYTALYHSLLTPNLFSDVDGRYRGMDQKIHQTDKHAMYHIFSLWDTFRAAHPLFTLVAPNKNADFINTMLVQFQQNGLLPVWELAANETGTMIGYHSIPVIWDAYQKGFRNFDAELAFEAMKKSAMQNNLGLKDYKNLGFIPMEREGNSVSKTIEYAYDDWCIAQMAKALNKEEDYLYFSKRCQNYKNLFESKTGFLRGRKANGNWKTPFNPIESSILGSGEYTEGNAWQYTFFAPHDINRLMALYGGDEAFVEKIDELFSLEPVRTNEHALDITGLIGQYAQGNEPSHHVAYLYNYVGAPWKTQKKVTLIRDSLYKSGPDGLCGNEDCGQMSSWYIFSAMGFYPVNPGDGQYIIGSPAFDKVIIQLQNGNTFTIEAPGAASKNNYITAATLNGEVYSNSYLTHEDILKGGTLQFNMSNTPNKSWGQAQANRPISQATPDELATKPLEESLVFVPYTQDNLVLFRRNKKVKLLCNTDGAAIHYTLDGTEPSAESKTYRHPIKLTKTTDLKAKAFKDGMQPSEVFNRHYIKALFKETSSACPRLYLTWPASENYPAKGINTLLDGAIGSDNYQDGEWLGFNTDVEAIIDLCATKKIARLHIGFLQNTSSWIFPPEKVEIAISSDGRNYNVIDILKNPTLSEHGNITRIENISKKINQRTRYIKVTAKGVETLPEWHAGAGNRPWIFVDEIIVEQ
ncbi:glycoside hydrolase family 92 protein [Marinilabiliaceae bacterium JC017]|nr:glycoside hydrolase family 92 protein [Marinilabiliaceae bacterium JC017]